MSVDHIVRLAGKTRRLSDLPGETLATTDPFVFYMGAPQYLSETGQVLAATDPIVVDDTVPQRVRRYSRTDEGSGPAPPPPPPPPSTTTLNPADKGTDCVLAPGNLSAISGTGGFTSARSIADGTKFYGEVTVAAISGVVGLFGFANGTANVNQYAGQNSDSVGYYFNGQVFQAGGSGTSYAGYADGDTIGIAVDRALNKAWFGNPDGSWNGDPVAGTGGIDISGISGAELFAMASPAACAHTFNFGATAFAHTQPAGFGLLVP